MTAQNRLFDAVRCLVQLADRAQSPRRVAEIATAEDLPVAQVFEVLEKLLDAELVEAVGLDSYRLARAASRIRVGDVRRALSESEESLPGFGGSQSIAALFEQETRWFDTVGPAQTA